MLALSCRTSCIFSSCLLFQKNNCDLLQVWWPASFLLFSSCASRRSRGLLRSPDCVGDAAAPAAPASAPSLFLLFSIMRLSTIRFLRLLSRAVVPRKLIPDMIRVPGNSHGTIPERAPTKRSSPLLAHSAHSPSALVQVPFIDKRLTLKHLFKSYPLKPTRVIP
jgi:hypothetical protein